MPFNLTHLGSSFIPYITPFSEVSKGNLWDIVQLLPTLFVDSVSSLKIHQQHLTIAILISWTTFLIWDSIMIANFTTKIFWESA